MKTKLISFFVVFALLAMFTACDKDHYDFQEPESELSEVDVKSAKLPPVALNPQLLVTGEWLVKNLDRPNVVVLHIGMDIRAGYNAAHIPGARFLALPQLQNPMMMLYEPSVLRAALEAVGVSTSSKVVVYGDVPMFGARAFFILEYLGHPSVALLDGGLAGWLAAGGLASTEVVTSPQGRMSPPPRSKRLVDADWVLDQLYDNRVILVDARPAGGFAAGHIPGAFNVPLASHFAANQMLKQPSELRELYAVTGARVQSPMVAYCQGGMMASVTYFIARYLGYDAMLYDGSWLEWTALGYPVAP
jgi:thiosulfate/3-mercaptopyruvate sulfurtransferase